MSPSQRTTAQAGRHDSHQRRGGETRMFAMTMPGLGPLAVGELSEVDGLEVSDRGFDGRSDVLLINASRPARADALNARLIEDVFVEVGRTLRSEGDKARWISQRIWRPERTGRALSIWSEMRGALRSRMTFRVIVRVLHEKAFLRTELRRELTRVIAQDRPRWQVADPGELEVWITEYLPGRFVAGLRLSGERMRQHDGRSSERPGALRPTAAAAMVRLAGDPSGVLFDPCCGSGTILSEGLAVGWEVRGTDIDPAAVEIARRNVPGALVALGDVRKIDLAGAEVQACVSNLPFGQQFQVEGQMESWLKAALGEIARVTEPGGRVVLLAPRIPRSAVPDVLQLAQRHRLRVLGTPTTLWSFDR